jgi:hypothetical protein
MRPSPDRAPNAAFADNDVLGQGHSGVADAVPHSHCHPVALPIWAAVLRAGRGDRVRPTRGRASATPRHPGKSCPRSARSVQPCQERGVSRADQRAAWRTSWLAHMENSTVRYDLDHAPHDAVMPCRVSGRWASISAREPRGAPLLRQRSCHVGYLRRSDAFVLIESCRPDCFRGFCEQPC